MRKSVDRITRELHDALPSGTVGAYPEPLGAPRTGYYVSRQGGLVERTVTYQSCDEIQARFPDAPFYGVWEDFDGRTYVDATDWVANFFDAVELGAQRKQLAVWDIANGCSVAVYRGEDVS